MARLLASGIHQGSDGALAVVQRGPSSVELFVPEAPPRLKLIASPAALESGDLRAHPGNYAISSWIASPSMRTVHAGAVALGGRGVLLLGVGGRGKTTTALACARDGFSFMGDDLCIVEAGDALTGRPPFVHGMFATAKLNPDSRTRLDASNWTELGTTPKGKNVVRVPEKLGFAHSVPLAVIVAVRAGQGMRTETRRLDPRDAFRQLILAAKQGTPGSVPTQWFSAAAAVAREVPVFELNLTWDLDRVTSTVRGIVDRVSAGEDVMKAAIATVVIGESYRRHYAQIFQPSVQRYAARMATTFCSSTIISVSLNSATPRPSSFMKLLIQVQPAMQAYERLMVLDADILAHRDAPPLTRWSWMTK